MKIPSLLLKAIPGIGFICTCSIAALAQQKVLATDTHITYAGRIKFDSTAYIATFSWPGSSAQLNFIGTEIGAVFQTKKGTSYYWAILDRDESTAIKFRPDSIKNSITLFDHLPYGKHQVTIYKITDCFTKDNFYGFILNENAQILAGAKPSKRKIEYYGDSITSGHGVDVADGDKDSGAPQFFDNYYTYGAITARHYNAQFSCIARSGIGLTVSYFPETMPDIYDRICEPDAGEKWDFKSFTPDIVVVNLFQNDSYLTKHPEHEQYKARFGTTVPTPEDMVNAYRKFITTLRKVYPDAYIICVLGNMDASRTSSEWPGYIEKAVSTLQDPKVLTHFFSFKRTPGHPKRREQRAMAAELIQFIDKNVKW